MEPTPTRCFDFECDEAKRLDWLPLAVRYKLDACGLRVSLCAWQAMELRERRQLLDAPLQQGAGGFASLAWAAGATRDSRAPPPGLRVVPPAFADYLALKRRDGAMSLK